MTTPEANAESSRAGRGGRIFYRLASPLAALLLLLAAAHVRFEYGAVASLYDPRPLAVGLGLTALSLFAAQTLLDRRRSHLAVVGLVAAGLVTVLGLRLLVFTYAEREVKFTAPDGTVLAGTLFAPRGTGPFPAATFLHGSGTADRRFFGWHAKLLARHGFAALAYDKRGAGRSGGSTWEVGYQGYAADAVAALEWLAARPEIDGGRLGVLGHSEGGWVAPLVAEKLPGLAFVVVTSATDLCPAEQIVYETRAAIAAAGYDESVVERATALQRRVLAYQRSGENRAAVQAALDAVASKPWFAVAELPRRLSDRQEYAWWRAVMDFDPAARWRNVQAPVLAVSGALDTNSDARASQAGIATALATGGNRRFTGEIFPRMEHSTVEWWLPGRLPPPRYPPAYRRLLVRWLRDTV